MISSRCTFSIRHFNKAILAAAVVLFSQGMPVMAEAPKSLLPAFGNEGAEFTTKAKDSHVTKGWLPTDWKDNSEWAPVSATYSKLHFQYRF